MIVVLILGAVFGLGILSLLKDDEIVDGVGHLYWPAQTSAVLDNIEASGIALFLGDDEGDRRYGQTKLNELVIL